MDRSGSSYFQKSPLSILNTALHNISTHSPFSGSRERGKILCREKKITQHTRNPRQLTQAEVCEKKILEKVIKKREKQEFRKKRVRRWGKSDIPVITANRQLVRKSEPRVCFPIYQII